MQHTAIKYLGECSPRTTSSWRLAWYRDAQGGLVARDLDQPAGILRIYSATWYGREDFLHWLNDGVTGRRTGTQQRLASWHVPDLPPDDDSDVFMLYDQGDLAESEYPPDDVVDAIHELARDAAFEDGIVWITNGFAGLTAEELPYAQTE